MSRSNPLSSLCAIVIAALCALAWTPRAHAAPQDSGFTYQGRLQQDGNPANGVFNFEFALFDQLQGGAQVGATLTADPLTVSAGLFTTRLDFGAGAFDGNQRFLQVRVNGTLLTPRTEVTSAPYASTALVALDALAAGSAQTTVWRGTTTNIVVPTTEVGTLGSRMSVVVGGDGLPIIAYYATVTLDLKVALCVDSACSSATTVTIDSAGDVGDFPSIVLGPLERPMISYYDRTNGDLKFARCNDRRCSSATRRTLDTLGDTGRHTSITSGRGGLENNIGGPIIAYYDATNGDLRVLRCPNDPNCISPVGTTLDSAGNVGEGTAIAFDGVRPLVAYRDVSNNQLKLAECSDSTCGSFQLRVLDSAPFSGFEPSIALSPSGRAVVAHARFNGTSSTIAMVVCNAVSAGAYCNAPTIPLTFSGSPGGLRTPQVMMINGNVPFVWDGAFRTTRCDDLVCAFASQPTAPSGIEQVNTATRSAATIGMNGAPLLLVNSNGIKVTQCADANCRTYGRDR